jgi:hypothetical protein
MNSQFEVRTMAKRKQVEQTGDTPAASPDSAAAKTPVKAELPLIESPSISPAEPEPASEPAAEPATVITLPTAAKPRFKWTPRNKRAALLAASVTLAAVFGAGVGAVSSGGFGASTPRADVAGLEERKAMQQSIAHLSKEVASLKTNLDAANKAAHSQIAKTAERLAASAADITGSISPPQTVAPVPTPRPAPHQEIAGIEPPPPARLAVVQGWTIRAARDGLVYVEGRGEIYQVVLGAPLPGLGPVETIKREDGRWMVVTPKGIIVSMRDRRYFE